MSIISDDLRARQTSLIDAWVLDLRVRGKAEATIDTYEEAVRRAHRQLHYGVAGSTTDELKAWLWHHDRAPSTRRTYRAALISFTSWVAEQGHVDYDAATLLPRIAVPAGHARPTPQDVLADILARANDPFRLWILMAVSMGLRAVEIARCDREHVGEDQTWVQGKGGKNVYLPTHPIVWAGVQPLPEGPIARRLDGSRANRKDVYRRANAHIRRLGHRGVTMHRMRHWHATEIFRANGRDLMLAKQAMRHTNVAHTQRYVAIDDPEVAAAQRALPLPI